MTNPNDPKLPIGLPVTFVGDEGFDRLCKFLGIANREQKNIIADLVKTRYPQFKSSLPRKLSTSQRWQELLTRFYASPIARREHWEFCLTDHPSTRSWPSLIERGFHLFDPTFNQRTLTPADIEATLSDFPNLIPSNEDPPPWQEPAIVLWPSLRNAILDLPSSATPSDERQFVLAVAVFSVATLLDDALILRWSADRSAFLADQFTFALPNTQESRNEEVIMSHSSTDKCLRDWSNVCRLTAKLASTLADNPEDTSSFERLQRRVPELASLRPRVLFVIRQTQQRTRIELTIRTLKKFGSEFGAPWFNNAMKSIEDSWTETYLLGNSIDSDAIARDCDRATQSVKAGIAEWRSAAKRKRQLERKFRKLLNSYNDIEHQFNDTREETTLHESLIRVNHVLEQTKQGILRASKPNGPTLTKSTKESLTAVSKEMHNLAKSDESLTISKELTVAANEAPLPSQGRKDTVSPTMTTHDNIVPNTTPHQPKGTEQRQQPVTPPLTLAKRSKPVSTPPATKTLTEVIPPSQGHDHPIHLLWHSISNRPGIAYHLARLLKETGFNHSALPPPHLLAATFLADEVYADESRTSNALRTHLAQIDTKDLIRGDDETNTALSLLLFCATLRPALLASSSGATPLLRETNLQSTLPSTHHLASIVSDHADRLSRVQQLDVRLISTALDKANWSRQFDATRASARDWVVKAKNQKILYWPAQRVWTKLLSKDQVLGQLATLLAESQPTQCAEVEALHRKLRDERSFGELVQRLDRVLRGKKGGRIQGRALSQLRQHAQPLLMVATEWIHLAKSKTNNEDFVHQGILALNTSLQRHAVFALDELDHAEGSTQSEHLRVSLRLARHAVTMLTGLFRKPRIPVEFDGVDPTALLGRDLLFADKLLLDTTFTPIGKPNGVVSILTQHRDHCDTIYAAFDRRLNSGDLVGAGLACAELEKAGDTNAHDCRKSLEDTLRRRRVDLMNSCRSLLGTLEQSLLLGNPSEASAESLRSRLVSVQGNIERLDLTTGAPALDKAKTELTDVIQLIADLDRRSKEYARTTLQGLGIDTNGAARDRIERLIAEGDLLTANELMSLLQSGQSLGEVDHDLCEDPFDHFMAAIRHIHAFTSDSSRIPQSKIDTVLGETGIPNVHVPPMPATEADDVKQLLEAWYELSSIKKFQSETFERLFQFIGLPSRRVTVDAQGVDYAKVVMETDTLEDKLTCPLPQFGSEACGRYRVLLNWAKQPGQSIPRLIDNRRRMATIVLHFGSLGPNRRSLAKWAISEHRMFIVVDESVIVFLARHPAARLSVLFQCVLPFSDADPYVTTSGLVPPELFVGRAREQKQIMDAGGPCFVYGGRQLGKTALLRSVERDFNVPETHQFAKWIDLKVREIGHARRPAEIWPLLWRELRDMDVLPRTVDEPHSHNPTHVDTLIRYIEDWIQHDGRRRLLLLLDEADGFLDADARQNFRESTRLKGLMDRTDRRVKVVFAGLHNVLRITERANHPLAHLGEPINVGPLLANGEWNEAHRLVRDPLKALGFRFKRPELATRVLAQTNYYPSLIQLYGAELVRHLRDSQRSAPYAISDIDLETAYRSTALRDAIRQRFQLTLQLDARYEVIAYALAYEVVEEGIDLHDGVDRRTLRDQARVWWEEGFQIDHREFGVLLQEMVGLGVLRSISAGRKYTLRNPNVLLLLGGSTEINEVLDKERESPKRFEPASFHARLSPSSSACFPLTYHQESTLRKRGGVAVIAGSSASAVGDIKRFFPKRMEAKSYLLASNLLSVPAFDKRLSRLRPQSPSGTFVMLIPHDEPWNVDWLIAAQKALGRKKKFRHRIKVVFVANAKRLWNILDQLESKEVGALEWIGIAPWDQIFLRHWLRENNQPHDKEKVALLMAASGGWPEVLKSFVHRKRKPKTWDGLVGALDDALSRTDRWLKKLGLDAAAEAQLQTLVQHSEISPKDIGSVAELAGIESTVLRRRVQWASHLGLLTEANGILRMNPLLQRLLCRRLEE